MREWLVAGALIERADDLLLVRNRRRDGSFDWSPPGGVIDPGESVDVGLAREVAEETGIVVQRWAGPAYRVEAIAPGMGWRMRVEVLAAVEFTGDVRVGDPDGIVVDACFVPAAVCEGHLAACQPWVREPLAAWLAERWTTCPLFRYEVRGADRASAVVTRL